MKIVMFYESKKLGGVETLFSEICNFANVSYLDERFKFHVYTKGEDSVYFDLVNNEYIINSLTELTVYDVVITPVSSLYILFRSFPKLKAKVVLWSLHPFNCLALTPGILRLKNKNVCSLRKINKLNYFDFIINKKILLEFVRRKSLIHMDQESRSALSFFYGIDSPADSIVPLFAPLRGEDENYFYNYQKGFGNNKVIWLGRDDDFKTLPLIDFLKTGILKEKELILVGFEDDKKNKDKFCKYVASVKFIPKLMGDDLKSFLSEGCFSLALGMGLSAITLASFGIPTILINPSNIEGDIKDPIKFYEAEGFSLGGYKGITRENKSVLHVQDLNFSLQEMILQKNMVDSFNKKITVNSILSHAGNAGLYLSSISSMMNFNLTQKAYSIFIKR